MSSSLINKNECGFILLFIGYQPKSTNLPIISISYGAAMVGLVPGDRLRGHRAPTASGRGKGSFYKHNNLEHFLYFEQ